MDAFALQLETDARDGRACSYGGAYRADGMLGNTAFRGTEVERREEGGRRSLRRALGVFRDYVFVGRL